MASMEVVAATLEAWKLAQYAAEMDEQGYDDLEFLKSMSDDALREVTKTVGMKPGHASKFCSYMSLLRAAKQDRRLVPAAPQPAASAKSAPPQPAASSSGEKVSMWSVISDALEQGLTQRDAIV